jgi:hypothetical protein
LTILGQQLDLSHRQQKQVGEPFGHAEPDQRVAIRAGSCEAFLFAVDNANKLGLATTCQRATKPKI